MPESGPPGADPGRGASLRGEVVYLYSFDVANEIRLDRAAELLSARPVPFAARPERAARESLPAARPLEVEPVPPAAGLSGRRVRPLVHVYDISPSSSSATGTWPGSSSTWTSGGPASSSGSGSQPRSVRGCADSPSPVAGPHTPEAPREPGRSRLRTVSQPNARSPLL